MNRREVLAALGASTSLLTGCLGTGVDSTPPTETPSTSRGELPATRWVSISDTAAIPPDTGLSVTASVERDRIAPDETARVTITLENTGTGRATDIADREYCHLFNRGAGGSAPRGLWLYRPQDAPASRDGGRWSQDETGTRTYIMIGCGKQQFDSGDAISTTYEVWDDYVTDEYLSPSTYRFETDIPLWESVADRDNPRTVEWWFELELSETKA